MFPVEETESYSMVCGLLKGLEDNLYSLGRNVNS